jgi:hypothetical protein
MSSPSQEHGGTHLQRFRAARLEQLIDYVEEPYFFLTCKFYRVTLPLPRVPAHFSSPKYHPYSYKVLWTHSERGKLSIYGVFRSNFTTEVLRN